jgi:hypothetical protein
LPRSESVQLLANNEIVDPKYNQKWFKMEFLTQIPIQTVVSNQVASKNAERRVKK